ncbi:hypothetical protein PsAD26_03119 [Pseudovibrio sp. Ad26]|nr:hypothetical protein PsAD26_03119 [Pseudovibrio sp. Ad26]
MQPFSTVCTISLNLTSKPIRLVKVRPSDRYIYDYKCDRTDRPVST